MARTRDLRPGFFKNEFLAECDPLARILYEGLWTLADREGRLEDRPQKIRIEILPYDDCDIEFLFCQLVAFGFIIRYEVEDKKCIWIPTFKDNQRIHPKEPPSVLPEYNHGMPRQVAEIPGNSEPDRTIPSSPSIPTLPSSPPTPKGESEGFQKFWLIYPKKTTKRESVSYWDKNKLDLFTDCILEGLEAWKISEQWTKDGGKFIPDPIRFLKNARWEDQPQKAQAPKPTGGTAVDGRTIVPAEQRQTISGTKL